MNNKEMQTANKLVREVWKNQFSVRVITGQLNLDIMKSRVYAICKILVGLIKQTDYIAQLSSYREVIYQHENRIWLLVTSLNNDLSVRCDEHLEGECVARNVFHAGDSVALGLSLPQVEKCFDDMPEFVRAMIKKFPKLKEKLAWHEKAAEKQL